MKKECCCAWCDKHRLSAEHTGRVIDSAASQCGEALTVNGHMDAKSKNNSIQ